jgi:hypothetical protein
MSSVSKMPVTQSESGYSELKQVEAAVNEVGRAEQTESQSAAAVELATGVTNVIMNIGPRRSVRRVPYVHSM